ncbi:TetR/AcrR family transcriptional regulator [Caldimonas brevitalea]|uniref:Transcriptional regulator, TetR family n=1 Tax=Caldimonas brevitalea TaxID=413882 RepID=A0A0G3BRP8_9BURK|nr:TetR/AcrR family transcriptional regulator [Caldimonas brevitalea]AKJ30051.1 transcriptional regulator, TetR family [Caldimonas brevitalea]
MRILLAAGRGFRKRGYEGIGVDGLAKEAGVTSGAFYVHFGSKAEAFKEAVLAGLRDLQAGVERFQAEHGPGWIEAFVDFYLSDKRTCDLSEACALQSLTPEVVRAEATVRDLYQSELAKVIDVIAKGLPQPNAAERRNSAWALISMLSGAVTIARAMHDAPQAAKVAKAVRPAAIAVARSASGAG